MNGMKQNKKSNLHILNTILQNKQPTCNLSIKMKQTFPDKQTVLLVHTVRLPSLWWDSGFALKQIWLCVQMLGSVKSHDAREFTAIKLQLLLKGRAFKYDMHYLSRSTSNHFKANDFENSFVQLQPFIEWNQEQVLKKIFSLILLWYMRRLTRCRTVQS